MLVPFAICLAAGLIGGIFTAPAITSGWYSALNKPFFTPPSWLFGPVWTILYLLMGLALFLVLKTKKPARKAKAAFAIQLSLNVLWSALFFGLRSPITGLLGIIALWLAIAFTIKEFFLVSKKAGWLLIPYIGWVSIAALLNLAVVLLNP